MSINTYGWLILAFPLAGAALIGLTFRALPSRVHGALGTLAIALSFVASVLLFLKLQDRAEDARQIVVVGWDYAKAAGIDAQLSLLVDPLSVLMILIVSGVSMLIHLYSVTYMTRDSGFVRYFAYLN